ncbi:trypsin V-B-like [Urocitellus parryii]
MKPLLWLYHVLCLVPYCYAMPQIERKGLISNSLNTRIPPLAISPDIPWLVPLSGSCQGIILSPWWILSTANCLHKTKLSNLNILEEDDQKSPLHGQRICIHPRFDPQDEEDAMKADIGMVLLSKPIYGDDVPLSHVPNVSLKSCSKCHYRSCQVYQHHSDPEFGVTGVKKILVQLLELSVCHPQYSHHEKSDFLCILSQPDQDCWVQQASPVLCLLNNNWELVGLVRKTSRICRHPTVIIRTAPYLSWIKQLIKASKKFLSPTSFLHCKTFFENVQISQIRQGYNYAPTLTSYQPSAQSLEENQLLAEYVSSLRLSAVSGPLLQDRSLQPSPPSATQPRLPLLQSGSPNLSTAFYPASAHCRSRSSATTAHSISAQATAASDILVSLFPRR